MIPRILIIAGSDSGGGAGIQADLKTVTLLGGHGMTAITALTAQNTLGVLGVELVSTAMVLSQIDAVWDDIGVDAVKIGMIGSAETALAVAQRLEGTKVPVVFDPVMVTTSGAALANADTVAAFERLMRLATVVTPNLPELAALTGGEGDALALARRLGTAVLAKGGHAEGEIIVDRLVRDGAETVEWRGSRIDPRHSHGTGCTLASGIATGLGAGLSLTDAIGQARQFVRRALLSAPGLGAGNGPMGFRPGRLD